MHASCILIEYYSDARDFRFFPTIMMIYSKMTLAESFKLLFDRKNKQIVFLKHFKA